MVQLDFGLGYNLHTKCNFQSFSTSWKSKNSFNFGNKFVYESLIYVQVSNVFLKDNFTLQITIFPLKTRDIRNQSLRN